MKTLLQILNEQSVSAGFKDSLINSDLHTFCACEIDEESITQESNIVLL